MLEICDRLPGGLPAQGLPEELEGGTAGGPFHHEDLAKTASSQDVIDTVLGINRLTLFHSGKVHSVEFLGYIKNTLGLYFIDKKY
jgi:hypothetical protein